MAPRLLTLTAHQKAEVIRKAISEGLPTKRLVWDEVQRINAKGNGYITVTVLRLDKTGYYFDFSPERTEWAPADMSWSDYLPNTNWEKQFTAVCTWFTLLKRELEAIDFLSQEFAEPHLFESGFSKDNSPLSEVDRQRVLKTIHEIEITIVADITAKDLPKEQLEQKLTHIENELNYIRESLARMGKKDWMNIAYSTLNNLVTALALSHEARETVGHALKAAFTFLTHIAPSLPSGF